MAEMTAFDAARALLSGTGASENIDLVPVGGECEVKCLYDIGGGRTRELKVGFRLRHRAPHADADMTAAALRALEEAADAMCREPADGWQTLSGGRRITDVRRGEGAVADTARDGTVTLSLPVTLYIRERVENTD